MRVFVSGASGVIGIHLLPLLVRASHESAVLDFRGTVLRYGRLYGPGTFYESDPPPPPRIHVDEAAERTLPTLEGPRGIVMVTEAA